MNEGEDDGKEVVDRGGHQKSVVTEVSLGLSWHAHTAPFYPTHFSFPWEGSRSVENSQNIFMEIPSPNNVQASKVLKATSVTLHQLRGGKDSQS